MPMLSFCRRIVITITILYVDPREEAVCARACVCRCGSLVPQRHSGKAEPLSPRISILAHLLFTPLSLLCTS